ncbi:Daunorubicin/doxorubicin resistance ATP-binding protein DrrA [bioreactor metagenome]|uniref:Daunorubicin/doxorubicin resistance ATP-binding protein DrrA n=1 Tax=bioreactor metagenome TaxID=1076179 RepID=A0A644VA52_9ZZZZ|nr:ATP-binding cassette domain-containing protein [Methanobrevibacter sp.]MEA4957767.1 ATP-binding cassette domain-containing protein [Methanobrevibacter sp.]
MTDNVIEVKNLVKSYKGSKKLSIDNISFSVKKGEFFAFLGPNGAGKTTTISILTTTLGKTSGEVKIAGFDIDKEDREVRKKIGIIFQKPSLDKQLTAEENIRFHACLYGMFTYRPTFNLMPKNYREKVMELAKVVDIDIDALFNPVKNLSGGMQRKLEIMRSLIHTPDVLFLDEPTQGLDAESRRSLWKYINEIRDKYGITIFLTTHYIDEAENADNVCIINKGKIATCSSPEKLKESLLKTQLIIDAENRDELIQELSELDIPFIIDKHIIVPYTKSPQKIFAQLKTELSVIKIHEPMLEDAYIEFLNKKNEVEA